MYIFLNQRKLSQEVKNKTRHNTWKIFIKVRLPEALATFRIPFCFPHFFAFRYLINQPGFINLKY